MLDMSNQKRKPGDLLPELYISGAEGQNRTADTGIFRPNFIKSINAVITTD